MPVLLQICVEGNTGSTGRIAESIGRFVIDKGWDSYIAYGRFPRRSESKLIKIGNSLDIFSHGIQTRLFDNHCLGSVRATRKLISEIDSIKPNIIQLHHLHGYYINMEILFNYLASSSIPVVWTFHDCWSFTGHCCHFDYIGCEKWKTECHYCPQKRQYPTSYFWDRSKANFLLKKKLFTSVEKMVIVSVSRWLNRVVGDSFLKNIERRVIFNGIDVCTFSQDGDVDSARKKYHLNNKFVILGVAKPWCERKRLKDFIELSKLINNECVILLVGLDPKQISSLPSNIIGLEKTEDQTELKDLYAAADLFMNLSVEETFGLTTAEAMSCGTPVVVYNATASPEIVDKKTGFVVQKFDIKALLSVVSHVKGVGKKSYSVFCRNRVLECFNQETQMAKYFELYRQLVDNI